MPANILNLPCYKVRSIQENEHDYHIDVETQEAPTSCPHCQSDNLVGFGRREQMVKDLPICSHAARAQGNGRHVRGVSAGRPLHCGVTKGTIMELTAYLTGGTAFAVALLLAFTGYGSRHERAIRFAIPAPLYVGAPICGLVIHYNQDMKVVLGLANMAILLAVLALVTLVVMVGASMWPPARTKPGGNA